MHVTHGNLEEQKHLVTRMRDAVVRMRDPANWDCEDLFGDWDGTVDVPQISTSSCDRSRSPGRLKSHDDTVAPVKTKAPKHHVFPAFVFQA